MDEAQTNASDPRDDDAEELLRQLFSLAASGGDETGLDEQAVARMQSYWRVFTAQRERFQRLEQVGRGGMGSVHRVLDRSLRRTVAFKTLDGAFDPREERWSAATARRVGRFLAEAQIVAQLEHPGIVPVHDLGIDERGAPFFTMRLVRGQDLERVFAESWDGSREWTRERVLGVLLRACETVAFAHDKGVIHRDLKPANLMVGRFGEVYVMDWGLARVARAKAVDPAKPANVSGVRTARETSSQSIAGAFETRDGDIVGTPHYMPPEQAAGDLNELSPHADVYAFGAMLYHLLARTPPYARRGESPSVPEVLARLCSGAPERLLTLDAELPRELTAICERAMERDPAERYATALELARDLRAYLEGRVVRAYETGATAELRKWLRRNRRWVAASAVLALGLLVAISYGAVVEARARRSLERQNAELAAAQAATRLRAETNEQVLAFLEGMFERQGRFEPGRASVTVSELLEGQDDELERRFANEPRVRVRLLSNLGWVHSSIGDFVRADDLLLRAAEVAETEVGANDGEALRAWTRLAANFARQQRFGEAAAAQERVVDAWTGSAGADGLETLRARRARANYMLAAGDAADAEAELARVVIALAATRGDGDGETLSTRHMLARALRDQGRLAEAIFEFERVLDGRRAAASPDDSALLQTLEELAELLAATDRGERALPMLESIASAWRARPDSHPSRATSLARLANALAAAKREPDAELAYAELVDLLEREPSRYREQLCSSQIALANLWIARGCATGAGELYEAALASLRNSGRDARDPRVVACLEGLCRARTACQRWDEALALLDELVSEGSASDPALLARVELLEKLRARRGER